ncbi:hypothetical protein C8R44DRAFT_893921 [Mycena epipterygia]|nr:hypothetical protein C8R44DRAFT_893921 [Mycena epipterygia]
MSATFARHLARVQSTAPPAHLRACASRSLHPHLPMVRHTYIASRAVRLRVAPRQCARPLPDAVAVGLSAAIATPTTECMGHCALIANPNRAPSVPTTPACRTRARPARINRNRRI